MNLPILTKISKLKKNEGVCWTTPINPQPLFMKTVNMNELADWYKY